MAGAFVFPLAKEFVQAFGGSEPIAFKEGQKVTIVTTETKQSNILTNYKGREVWLPIRFFDLDPSIFPSGELLMPWAVISVTGKKEFIRTPMAQRNGSVKELFNIDDYDIQIKGFLIDLEGRSFPEAQLMELYKLWNIGGAIGLDNALTNVFLPEDREFRKVVITGFNLPEVEGGKKHVRPFSMTLESDQIFTLEDEKVE